MAIQGTVQGDKNPIQRKTIKRIVNFDSHYREILDPSGTTCTNNEFNKSNPQVRLYTSTNYMEFDSEQDAFIYLNKNIYYNDSDKQKPNFASVAKYCEEFKFRFYERRY